MPSFGARRRTGAYSFLSRLPRTKPLPSAPPRQRRVAAYLAKADIGPQHSVRSRLWQREVVIQESREGFIVHQEIPQRQTCREMVFCFHLISNSKKKKCQHNGASGENYHTTDCLLLNRWIATGFWRKRAEQQGSGASPSGRDTMRLLSEDVGSHAQYALLGCTALCTPAQPALAFQGKDEPSKGSHPSHLRSAALTPVLLPPAASQMAQIRGV